MFFVDFYSPANKMKHVGLHKCSKCGRPYSWRQTLLRHMKYECGVNPMFHCQLCSISFKQKGHLLRHVKNKHPAQLDVYYRSVVHI